MNPRRRRLARLRRKARAASRWSVHNAIEWSKARMDLALFGVGACSIEPDGSWWHVPIHTLPISRLNALRPG